MSCAANKSIGERSGDTKNPDGSVRVQNPHLALMSEDFLYHLNLGTTQNLVEMFNDVKFICTGGTPQRMESFANYIQEEIGYKLPTGTKLMDISELGHRYAMFKVGPVLSVSHGMGGPSISILLHELIKLMHYAKCKDPIFFRLGTCGGLGLPPGTVVVSKEALDGMLHKYHELPVLGKLVQRPTKLDNELANELKALSQKDDAFETVIGNTMCTDDFYEGQCRLDGAYCDYTEADKMQYLQSLRDQGIVNIEMESAPFAALTHRAGIKAAVLCVTILDRLKGDQVNASAEELEEWQTRPQIIVGRYIKKCLKCT